jgi:hypothetical protein
MDSDINKFNVQFEIMKMFNDSLISYKFSAGSHNLTWMQTLNSKILGGFEMFYVPQNT